MTDRGAEHEEGTTMNENVFQGKWKQLRGRAKEAWGKLTDDDLERTEGRYDAFVGTLQERYGYARDEAEKAVAKVLETLKD